MKIIHQTGYTDKDRRGFIATIHNNTIQSIKDLIGALTTLELTPDPAIVGDIEVLNGVKYQDTLTTELAAAISRVWKNGVIQQAYKRRNEFQLFDSASYYFEKVAEIASAEYIPSDQDILRTRVRTSGIVETSFDVEGNTFKMFDVGGQRNERRKWIHCFDNVQAVLFVVAMSEYDQFLYEDETQNRITEAMTLFGEICNSRFFEHTAMILFLNKNDLFQEKIKNVDLNIFFPDYTVGCNYDNGVEFMRLKFLALNRQEEKQVYVHVTCATDTKNIQFVFEAVKDIVLTQNLKGSGFI
jgi:guanine nucleotide-binding protein subunit alpha